MKQKDTTLVGRRERPCLLMTMGGSTRKFRGLPCMFLLIPKITCDWFTTLPAAASACEASLGTYPPQPLAHDPGPQGMISLAVVHLKGLWRSKNNDRPVSW